jgi:hypothetical protein
MKRVNKNLCPAMISASIMMANMWKNSMKNVESNNNKILYETLLDFFYSETVHTFWISLVSYHITSHHITSCHIYHITSYHISYHAISCNIIYISCHIIPYHIIYEETINCSDIAYPAPKRIQKGWSQWMIRFSCKLWLTLRLPN